MAYPDLVDGSTAEDELELVHPEEQAPYFNFDLPDDEDEDE